MTAERKKYTSLVIFRLFALLADFCTVAPQRQKPAKSAKLRKIDNLVHFFPRPSLDEFCWIRNMMSTGARPARNKNLGSGTMPEPLQILLWKYRNTWTPKMKIFGNASEVGQRQVVEIRPMGGCRGSRALFLTYTDDFIQTEPPPGPTTSEPQVGKSFVTLFLYNVAFRAHDFFFRPYWGIGTPMKPCVPCHDAKTPH